MTDSPVFSDVDYNLNGKQIGSLFLPHSIDRSAYGNICVPIAVIRNGPGPTALFIAGSHGDEYEGQVALSKLVREIEPSEIAGRIIAIPAANLPAAIAGRRLSPIDGGNLNRAFPGDPKGGPTDLIAHYIDNVLIPLADLIQDFHSGGSSLEYLPLGAFQRSGDTGLDSRAATALREFGAPLSLRWSESIGRGQIASAGALRGKVTIGGEFGGAGTISTSGLAIVSSGLRNILVHLGILPPSQTRKAIPTRFLEVRGRDYYVVASSSGVLEFKVELGGDVEEGQVCALVHFPDSPARPPEELRFRRSGLMICRRPIARVERGDVVAHLGTDLTPEQLELLEHVHNQQV